MTANDNSDVRDHDPKRNAAAEPTLPLRAAHEPPPLRRLGDYELLSEIARGGMGVVFRARQVSLDRIVAVKMILSGELAGKEELSRFRTEAEAAAQLQHPAIVPIYEVGEHEGRHYFSMACIDGSDLATLVGESPLPPSRAATLVAEVADAIHYAHEHGIVHRDLKPSNVIIDRDGKPHVTDFGLAKRIDSGASLTSTGQILGTPAYMPPEQAAGRKDAVGPRSDVYALGAILYEALTGRPPYKADNAIETLRQVLDPDVEPALARQLNPAVSVDLETICGKCLAKEPERRYASARELGEDLRRHLEGRPILARPLSRVERAVRLVQRNPLVSALASAVALLVMVAAGAATVGYLETSSALARESSARSDAQRKRDAAVEKEQAALRSLYGAEILLAEQAWGTGDLSRMYELLERYRSPSSFDPRGFEWGYLYRLGRSGHVIAGERRLAPLEVGFTHDDCRLLLADGDGIMVEDGAALMPVLATAPGTIDVAAFTPDGKYAVIGYEHGVVDLVDLKSGTQEPVLPLEPDAKVWAVAVSEDGQLVAVSLGRTIVIARIGSKAVIRILAAASVESLSFRRDGKVMAAADAHRDLLLYDTQSGATLQSDKLDLADRIRAMAFSPDGTTLALGVDVGTGARPARVLLWDVAARKVARAIVGEHGSVRDLAWGADGSSLAAAIGGLGKGMVLFIDASSGEVTARMRGHFKSASAVAFSPDGQRLATGGWDHTVRLWDIGKPQAWDEVPVRRGAFCAAAFLASGELLTASGPLPKREAPAGVTIWEPSEHAATAVLTDPDLSPFGLSVAPDGRTLAVGGSFRSRRQGRVVLWDGRTGRSLGALPDVGGIVQGLAFSPDGATLATTTLDGKLRLWRAASRELVRDIDLPARGRANAVAFPTSEELVAGVGRMLLTYSTATGSPMRQDLTDLSYINVIALSPDRATMAVAGQHVELWDLATRCERQRLTGHSDPVRALAFSPDGRRLATGGIDASVMLWDVASGQQLLTLEGHPAEVYALAFSPDGATLVSAGEPARVMDAGVLRIWRAVDATEAAAPPAGYSSRSAHLEAPPPGSTGAYPFDRAVVR